MDTISTTNRADSILDLGEKGCSRLLGDIEDAMRPLNAGQTLLVLANDPAAPLDIKVWSRKTGNPLLSINAEANQFLLQKK